VDEEKGVGWFASDRFQPEDSVCVLRLFPTNKLRCSKIPTEHLWRIEPVFRQFAQHGRRRRYSSLIAQAKENNSANGTSPKRDFEFVIDDSRTYHQLSDFKNANARNLYAKALNLQQQLEKIEKELSDKRDRYAQANQAEKSNLAPSILSLEKDAESLHRQIEDLSFRVATQR
jgi:hypothetical protein